MAKKNVVKNNAMESVVSPGLMFQSPTRNNSSVKKVEDKRRNLTPSPSFGSSPIRDAHSYGGNAIGAESPNSSFSTDLRTWIGDEDINNFLDSTSVHQKRYKNQELQHLGDTIAVIQNEMQAQIDALLVKVTQWRSKDQKDMFRDRELLLEGMRNSSEKIKSVAVKQNEIKMTLHGIVTNNEKERENNNNNNNNKNVVNNGKNDDGSKKSPEAIDSALILRIKNSLDRFELQEHTINELQNKIHMIGEKQQVINLDLNQLQDTVENAVASLQGQIHTMLNAQHTIVKEISDRNQNERLFKEEIKRLEMLFAELSKSQQITEETSKIFMDEMITWRKEVDMNNNIFNQNMNRITNSYSRLRNETNRDKMYEDRSFKGLHVSVEICEDEIRKLKKQLTLAVKLFRKRNDNLDHSNTSNRSNSTLDITSNVNSNKLSSSKW